MIYALDTNVVIEVLRENKAMKDRLIATSMFDIVLVPPFVEYEVLRGLYDRESKKQEKIFEVVLHSCSFVKVDMRNVMYHAAKLHAERKKAGKSIEDVDLFIAAWCMETGAVLVTENIKHFEDTPGLTYENWNER
jgi:tRNA(fMet)-specific endonuclease VapC